MPRARKINLEKVRASLDALCPKYGRVIPPAEVRRIDFERIERPVCGASCLCHGLSKPAVLFFWQCIYLNARQEEIVDDRRKVKNEV
jgi:hypothetical protein